MAAYARYEATFGKDDKPTENEEPTLEQLSAVAFLIRSGVNPYTDFGVWGPHGHRILKKAKLLGCIWNNDNPPQLVKVEIHGPASYSMWRASYIIYMNVMIMLDAVDLGPLLAYMRKQDAYHEKYGSRVWALQYQTEVRTRSEHLVRIKRTAMADYGKELLKYIDWYGSREKALYNFTHPDDPQRPWNFVFT